jgi:glycosyltransferase 2 family protein
MNVDTPQQSAANQRRWASLLIGIAGSGFFLWLGFRGLDFSELWDTIRNIRFGWVGLAVPIYFIAIYILTWRWWYLLRSVQNVHPNRLYPVVVVGYMANNLLPFRLGEVLRAYVLKRRDSVAIPPTLTTIFVERVFDGLTMLTLIFAALLFVEFEEPRLRTIILVTTPLFFGALALFFWIASNPEMTRRLTDWVTTRFLPAPVQEKVKNLSEELLTGLDALRSKQALAGIIFYSLFSWVVEASTYWFVMQAFDFSVSFPVLLLVVGFGNLSTILPSTAGYIGTFHAAAILTLTAFDVDRADAGSYAIVMHATLWLPITVVGFIAFLRMGFEWSEINRAQQVVQESES